MLDWLKEKMLRILYPQAWSVYHGVEVSRCQTDGQLLTKSLHHLLRYHGGHHFKSPTVLSLKEKVLIWLKILQ